VLAFSFGTMIFVLPISRWVVEIMLEFRRTRPAPTRPKPKTGKARPVPVNSMKNRGPQETHGEKMARALAKGLYKQRSRRLSLA
jgi:hypothetical protein